MTSRVSGERGCASPGDPVMFALGQHVAHGNSDGVREVYGHGRRDLRIERDRRIH